MTGYRPMPSILTTSRLTLGPWRTEDFGTYRVLIHERDPRAAAAPRDGQPTNQEVHATIRAQQATLASTGVALYAVRLQLVFIGYCGLTAGRSSPEEPELAYELSGAVHGRGYATEAARAVVEVAVATGRRHDPGRSGRDRRRRGQSGPH